MTSSVEIDPKAIWAIEIERKGSGGRTEFFNALAVEADADEVSVIMTDGTQVSFKTKNLRKLLLMTVKSKESA